MSENNGNDELESMVDYEATMQRLGNDEELFREFVEIFLDDAPGLLAKINDGIGAKQSRQIREATHALKGLALNFGAKKFCKLAQSIEDAAAKGDVDACLMQQALFNSTFESLHAELNRLSSR